MGAVTEIDVFDQDGYIGLTYECSTASRGAV